MLGTRCSRKKTVKEEVDCWQNAGRFHQGRVSAQHHDASGRSSPSDNTRILSRRQRFGAVPW